MIKNKLFQLAKLILQLASLETTNGVKLIYEGSLEVGTEVFIEEEGELKPAPNAEYVTEDKTIVVKDGKVEAVEEASMVLSLIKGYNISYPVFLDVEPSGGRGDSISKEVRTNIIELYNIVLISHIRHISRRVNLLFTSFLLQFLCYLTVET